MLIIQQLNENIENIAVNEHGAKWGWGCSVAVGAWEKAFFFLSLDSTRLGCCKL